MNLDVPPSQQNTSTSQRPGYSTEQFEKFVKERKGMFATTTFLIQSSDDITPDPVEDKTQGTFAFFEQD